MKVGKLLVHPSRIARLARKELAIHRRLHGEVQAALMRLEDGSRGFAQRRAQAYGCAVFPSVGQASAVLGGSYGLGEVYRADKLIGYAGLARFTVGVQLGGHTTAEVFLFGDREVLKAFQRGGTTLTARAGVVLVKAEAEGAWQPRSRGKLMVRSNGGLLLEATAGLQKIVFAPAALTRRARFHSAHPTTHESAARGARARVLSRSELDTRKAG